MEWLPESLRNIKSIVLFKENYKSYIKPKFLKRVYFFLINNNIINILFVSV